MNKKAEFDNVERWSQVFLELDKLNEEQLLESKRASKPASIDQLFQDLAEEAKTITAERIGNEISKVLKSKVLNDYSSICLFRFELKTSNQIGYLKVLEEIVDKSQLNIVEKIKLYVLRNKYFDTTRLKVVKILVLKSLLIQLKSLKYKPYLFVDADAINNYNSVVVGIGITSERYIDK